jgi:hypothetical protein
MTSIKISVERLYTYMIIARTWMWHVIYVTSVTISAVLEENCASTLVTLTDLSSVASAKRSFMLMGVGGKRSQLVHLPRDRSKQAIDAISALETSQD